MGSGRDGENQRKICKKTCTVIPRSACLVVGRIGTDGARRGAGGRAGGRARRRTGGRESGAEARVRRRDVNGGAGRLARGVQLKVDSLQIRLSF